MISAPSEVPRSARSHGCSPKTYLVRVIARMSSSICCTLWANSGKVRAWANTTAPMAPADVAVMMSGRMPSVAIRYCSAPTSNDPLVPPPAKTNTVEPPRGSSIIRKL